MTLYYYYCSIKIEKEIDMKAPEKTIKVTELKNMARILAEKNIELNGEYFCMIDGICVRVIK